MATFTENKKAMWGIFAISFVVMVALLVVAPQWFWVPLPFVLTFLVYALDIV